MNDNPEESIRKLFSDQAKRDRAASAPFDQTLRAARPAPRVAFTRMAIAASLLIIAGILLTLTLRNTSTPQKPAPQFALPNLLEGLDTPAETPWQSPTAFLLDLSNPTNNNTGTSPENPSQTRQSNG